MMRRQINSVTHKGAKTQVERYRETEIELVNVATTYRDDIDQWNDEQKASIIITNERHSKAMWEEQASKWNIGIQTAKDTLRVTTQRGI